MTGRTWQRFMDHNPEDLPHPDVNPYLKLHREWGPPVLTATQSAANKGRWSSAFARSQPLHVEVGPGNGFHLAGMASRHPDQNWLGIEIRYKRVILCAKKIEGAGVTDNARVCRYDAWWLDDVFAPGEIDGLYVHHPDPWKRDVDRSKRLMSPFFAGWAARAMKPGALLRLKTDHRRNIDWLVSAFDTLPFEVVERRDDVVHAGYPWPTEDDVITNYESKFHKRNEPIFALLARRVEGEAPPLVEAVREEAEGHPERSVASTNLHRESLQQTPEVDPVDNKEEDRG